MLILLFGYGLSFDVRDAPVGDRARRPVAGGARRRGRAPRVAIHRSRVAHQHARGRRADARSARFEGIVRVPVDFARQLSAGHAQIQLVVNGVDTNTAATIESYVTGAIGIWAQRQADRAGNAAGGVGSVVVVPRMWFNEAIEQHLVSRARTAGPGADADRRVSDLACSSRANGSAARSKPLFVTPVRPLELVLAKLAPYLVIGTIDLFVCLLAAHFLFEVPIRGSMLAIVVSSLLYLTVSLSLGLFISGATRSQFLASQMALLASFMPALMLSGFIFDLRNAPVADSDRQPGPAGDALHGAVEDAVPGRRQLGVGRPQLFHPGVLRVRPDRGVATEPAKAAAVTRMRALVSYIVRVGFLCRKELLVLLADPHESRDDIRCRPCCSRCSSAMGRRTI